MKTALASVRAINPNTTWHALTLSSAAASRKSKLFILPIRICYAKPSSTERSLRRTLLRVRRRRRPGKLGIIHRDVLLHFAHLNREPTARPRQRPPKRNLHPAGVPVIFVIDLRWHPAQRRLSISNQPHQQPRPLVEIQPQRRFAVALPNHQVRIVVTNLLRTLHMHFAEHLPQV